MPWTCRRGGIEMVSPAMQQGGEFTVVLVALTCDRNAYASSTVASRGK